MLDLAGLVDFRLERGRGPSSSGAVLVGCLYEDRFNRVRRLLRCGFGMS